MPRIVLQRFQDQHVERAVNEVGFFFGHCNLDSLGEKMFELSLDSQGKSNCVCYSCAGRITRKEFSSMHQTKAYAAQSATSPLGPFSLRRREPTARDVQIDIMYCGVCHSDLHTARSEWGPSTYPCVPGHEIVGRVTGIGDEVDKFREGDFAAVGCMVDSDRTCPNCRAGLEQFCESG